MNAADSQRCPTTRPRPFRRPLAASTRHGLRCAPISRQLQFGNRPRRRETRNLTLPGNGRTRKIIRTRVFRAIPVTRQRTLGQILSKSRRVFPGRKYHQGKRERAARAAATLTATLTATDSPHGHEASAPRSRPAAGRHARVASLLGWQRASPDRAARQVSRHRISGRPVINIDRLVFPRRSEAIWIR